MRSAFVLFGPTYLTAPALVVPLVLAALAWRRPQIDAPIRYALAVLLAGGWLGWFALFAARGWLTVSNVRNFVLNLV